MENISVNFAEEIKNPAARSFYALQTIYGGYFTAEFIQN
jgi:hypothetical protein